MTKHIQCMTGEICAVSTGGEDKMLESMDATTLFKGDLEINYYKEYSVYDYCC